MLSTVATYSFDHVVINHQLGISLQAGTGVVVVLQTDKPLNMNIITLRSKRSIVGLTVITQGYSVVGYSPSLIMNSWFYPGEGAGGHLPPPRISVAPPSTSILTV